MTMNVSQKRKPVGKEGAGAQQEGSGSRHAGQDQRREKTTPQKERPEGDQSAERERERVGNDTGKLHKAGA